MLIKGDIIVSKFIQIKDKNGNKTYIENHSRVSKNEVGYIDNIFVDYTLDGHKIVKIVIRKIRIPEIGDKFDLVQLKKVLLV